jgi:hypothetical protein
MGTGGFPATEKGYSPSSARAVLFLSLIVTMCPKSSESSPPLRDKATLERLIKYGLSPYSSGFSPGAGGWFSMARNRSVASTTAPFLSVALAVASPTLKEPAVGKTVTAIV